MENNKMAMLDPVPAIFISIGVKYEVRVLGCVRQALKV